jgi:hypothetical protein
VKVRHDIGSAKDFRLFVRKANSADDFSALTDISNDGGTSVDSATGTTLKFENISMGDCSNGIEIFLLATTGAVTNKNVWVAEMQLEEGAVATPFGVSLIDAEINSCQRTTESTFDLSVNPADNLTANFYHGFAWATNVCRVTIPFKQRKRTSGASPTFYQPISGASAGKWSYYVTGSGWLDATTMTPILVQEDSISFDLVGTFTADRSYMVTGNLFMDDEL